MSSTFKTQKLQIYKAQGAKTAEGIVYYKKYPYAKHIHEKGGLWCSAIQKQADEEKINSAVKTVKKIDVRINNHRFAIDNTMKAVFKNEIYDVGVTDEYDFKSKEIKITLTASVDNNEYEEEALFADD